MEEAIVDVALDLNLIPPGERPQEEAQQGMRPDHRDQAQLLATASQAQEARTPWPQNRVARVEILRQRVANGVYEVDNAELARCILRNSTRFVETR